MQAAEIKKRFASKAELIGNIAYPVIGAGVFLLVWFIAAKVTDMEIILPTPARAFEEFFTLLGTKDFYVAVGGTLGRALISFALAFVFAVFLAVAGYLLPPLSKVLAPVITILRSVPTMSIILLSLIWLTSKESPVLITFLIVFPLLYSSLERSLKNIDRYALAMSKVFGVPLLTRIYRMYIPAVLPDTIAAARSNISLGLKVMIASEVLAQTVKSMGVAMQISRVYLDTASLMGWTIAAVVLSYLLEGAVLLIGRFLVRWKR